MATSDAYGQRLSDRLRVENAPSIIARVLRKVEIAVTEIRSDDPMPGISGTIHREEAFLVGLQLRDFPAHVYWENGQKARVCDLRAGQTCFHDLKRDLVLLLDKPYHCLYFYLPRTALDAITDNANAPRIGDLNYEPGVGVDDSTIANLGASMLFALKSPAQANQLFVEHVTLAVGMHVARMYGGMVSRPARGGLAPWQIRRAEEILSADSESGIRLKEVAEECHMSVSHFSRAFRRTMGVAPHKWLLTLRIESAKGKLRDHRLSLSDVALASGFADQSHFTRIFTRAVGTSPGAWRRALNE